MLCAECETERPGCLRMAGPIFFCFSSLSARLKRRVNAVTGRNERCPCGSKRKYRKCCLYISETKPDAPPPELIARAVRDMRKKQHAQEQWTAQYGHVRPCIHTDNWGKKFIAAGKRLLWSDKWKFIPDFLLDYVPGLFGKEWWDAEVAKQEAERHQVFQWRAGCLRHRQTAQPAGDGKWVVAPDGNSSAYLALAFNCLR